MADQNEADPVLMNTELPGLDIEVEVRAGDQQGKATGSRLRVQGIDSGGERGNPRVGTMAPVE